MKKIDEDSSDANGGKLQVDRNPQERLPKPKKKNLNKESISLIINIVLAVTATITAITACLSARYSAQSSQSANLAATASKEQTDISRKSLDEMKKSIRIMEKNLVLVEKELSLFKEEGEKNTEPIVTVEFARQPDRLIVKNIGKIEVCNVEFWYQEISLFPGYNPGGVMTGRQVLGNLKPDEFKEYVLDKERLIGNMKAESTFPWAKEIYKSDVMSTLCCYELSYRRFIDRKKFTNDPVLLEVFPNGGVWEVAKSGWNKFKSDLIRKIYPSLAEKLEKQLH